jgi:hypothetical protein
MESFNKEVGGHLEVGHKNFYCVICLLEGVGASTSRYLFLFLLQEAVSTVVVDGVMLVMMG